MYPFQSERKGSVIEFIILLGDLLIVNCILFFTCRLYPIILQGGHSVGMLHGAVTFMYVLSSGTRGVILHYRSVRAYQIVKNAFGNCALFLFFSILLLYWDKHTEILGEEYFFVWLVLLFSISFYHIVLRVLMKAYRSNGGNQRYVVLVGDTYNSIQLCKYMDMNRFTGYKVLGYFASSPSSAYPDTCPFLGTPDTAVSWMRKHPQVHQLYCSLPASDKEMIISIIDYCENHLVYFYTLPDLYNYLHHRVYFHTMDTVPYLSLRQNPLQYTENKLIKRAFDLLFSSVFLCTIFPIVLVIVTVITKLTMPGPVFFKQKRNGLNDEEFYCYKFRSMRVNKDADNIQATKDDPRKTKWGNIMRRTNIDEFPQFINVFKGEMSVVGPRPHMVKHTEEYSKLIDKYMVRHFVKPGITGWSQVTGFRGETKELKDMKGRIQGDIWYIEHWNIWLDLYIIYKTVINMFHGEENAY